MIQRKLFKKCLTLALAVATAVTSVSVPGGLLAPEKVYAEDATQDKTPQEPLQGVTLRARVNEEYTAYIIDVLNLVDIDTVKYEFSIGDETNYLPLAELEKKAFGADITVELYVRKAETDTLAASLATKGAITTPAASEAPVISGEEKFKDSTTVTITATDSAIHYTTDGTTPTATSTEYTAPIQVTSTAAIKAIAIKADNSRIMSAVVEKTFTKESSGGSSSGGSSSGGSSSGGSTESGSETTPPQGDNKSNVTTRTETREDGTIVTTTETWAEDGSVQIRTEIRNEKTGMSIVVNVSKNAKGKITSAAAEIFDRGFGNVKITGEALSEIVNAAGTKNVNTTIKMLTKNGWVIREVSVNANTLLKRTSLRNKKMKVIEIDPETGEKIVVSKTPFKAAADGSIELDADELGYGIYEIVTAAEEEALTKKLLQSVKSAKKSTSISEGKKTWFQIDNGISWYNIDDVTYLTGNPNVAKVDSEGRITGLKPGRTIIKAVVRLKNGKSKVLTMTVTVNEKN